MSSWRIVDETEVDMNTMKYTTAAILHAAAIIGNPTFTKSLIYKGYNVDVLDSNGSTPLIYASKHDNLDVIRVLVEANASVLITNNEGDSAAKIILGNKKWRHKIVDIILKKVKKECRNDSLRTAKELLKVNCSLPRAMYLKDTVITKYMLENGCDVNDQDIDDEKCLTALHSAVSLSDLKNIRLLLDYGANVNANNRMGRVMEYVKKVETLEILLSNGAQVVDDDGNLVVDHIFKRWQKEIVEKLIRNYNLDLSAKSVDNESTLFHLLVSNQNFDPIEILESKFDNSIDINEADNVGETPLMLAINACNYDTVKFLLKRGAEIDAADNKDRAMSYLVYPLDRHTKTKQKSRMRIVMLLFEYGVDVQWIHKRGHMCLLDYVLSFDTFEIAKLILARLAMMEILGCEIKEFISAKINFHEMFYNYYNSCKTEIYKMNRNVIYKSVTLFKLAVASNHEFACLARSQLFLNIVGKFLNVKKRKLYYYRIVRKRAIQAVKIINLRKNAFEMVSQIQGLKRNHLVIQNIVDYLIYHNVQAIINY